MIYHSLNRKYENIAKKYYHTKLTNALILIFGKKLAKENPQSVANPREEWTCAQESKMGNEQSDKGAEKFFTDAGLKPLVVFLGLQAKAIRAAVGQLPSGGPAHVGHPSQGQAGHAAECGKAMLDKAIGKTSSEMFTF